MALLFYIAHKIDLFQIDIKLLLKDGLDVTQRMLSFLPAIEHAYSTELIFVSSSSAKSSSSAALIHEKKRNMMRTECL